MSWNTETRENLTHGLKQRAHAKKRLRERYGIRMNRRDYPVVRELARISTRVIYRDAHHKVSLIQCQGKTVLAVYDCETAEIATFLPLFSPLRKAPEPKI